MEEIRKILAAVRLADERFNLIENGDKIAVGISGGKDSLLLAYALNLYTRFSRKHFTLIGITLNLGFPGFEGDYLKDYFQSRNIEYHIEDASTVYPILAIQQERMGINHLPCSICSRMKKAAMNKAAQKYGCNKVAFAHHADDAIETLFLNEINGGRVATFAPKMRLEREDITFIRPFILTFEKSIIKATKQLHLPVRPSSCPADKHTEREEIKQVLKGLYDKYSQCHTNFLTMITNALKFDLWFDELNYQTRKSGLVVKPVNSIEDKTAVLYIRMKVFVEEQNCPLDEEITPEENSANYFLLVYKGVNVGTIRYYIDNGYYHIGRFAILSAYRKMGLGRILFQWLEEYLYRNNGKITIAFNGQAYLKDFYESLGYTTDGKIVMDAGIKHYHFERTIDKLPASCFLPNEE